MSDITKHQLENWIDEHKDLVLIDVLPREKFETRHIPTAINVPFKDNPNFVQQVESHLSSQAQKVVVYCGNSECPLSKEAAEVLHEAGLTNVHRFEAGVEGWFDNKKAAA